MSSRVPELSPLKIPLSRLFVSIADLFPSLVVSLLVELVALLSLPAVGPLGVVLGAARVAGARRVGRRMRVLAEHLPVGVGRISRVLALVVGVRPLGGIGGG